MNTSMKLEIDESRFRDTYEKYSQIGATENGGLNRVALSESDKEVRDEFISDLNDLNLDISIDKAGNIFGYQEGENEALDPVLIGSHLDSQPYGGRFDGQLGVLCALETLRSIDDENLITTRPIEIVNWTNEEGTRFPALGSATFVGKNSIEQTLSVEDADGITYGKALQKIGYDGDKPCEPHPVDSFLELHIEQGKILEKSDTDIGIVQGVVGMKWFRVTITGDTDHAGSTPMHDRSDALATAASVIDRIRTLSTYSSDDIVFTVGELNVEPGSKNIIPGKVEFTIDIRSYDDDVRKRAIERIKEELSAATTREDTTFKMEEYTSVDHTIFSSKVQEAISKAVASVGASSKSMISKGGHDAMHLNAITDTAMIFVPSVDGKSHSEEEYTEWEDVVTGANTYLNSVLNLSSS